MKVEYSENIQTLKTKRSRKQIISHSFPFSSILSCCPKLRQGYESPQDLLSFLIPKSYNFNNHQVYSPRMQYPHQTNLIKHIPSKKNEVKGIKQVWSRVFFSVLHKHAERHHGLSLLQWIKSMHLTMCKAWGNLHLGRNTDCENYQFEI